MRNSVIEAIRLGRWNFEPEPVGPQVYAATQAAPGSDEKLQVLADRARRGLPLWHPADRNDHENQHRLRLDDL